MEIAGYFSAVLIGVSLGLIGGGGSILTVPVFVYLLHVQPVLATTYSLFVVGSCSLVGGARAYLKRLIDFQVVLYFGLPSLLSVFAVRRFLLPKIPDQLFSIGNLNVTKGVFLMVLFALLMLAAAVSMIRSANNNHPIPSYWPKACRWILVIQGFFNWRYYRFIRRRRWFPHHSFIGAHKQVANENSRWLFTDHYGHKFFLWVF